MNEEELSKRARKLILEARKFNLITVSIGLPVIGILGYIGVNVDYHNKWWLPVLTIIGGVLGHVLLAQESIHTGGVARCPKCGVIIERSQFPGKVMPNKCSGCGLKIKI